MTLPPLIRRRDLQASLGVSSETMRVRIKKRQFPPLDVDLSPTLQGWYPDTLRAFGINVPDPQPAAQQAAASLHTPAASAP